MWYIRIIRFCSNFTSIWSKYLSNNVWKNFRFARSENQFFQKFDIEILLCYRCKFWHWKSKVSPCIIWYTLGHMLGKLEPNRIVRNVQNFEFEFEFYNKKPSFLKPFFEKMLTPFCKPFLQLNKCLMVSYYFSDYHLSVFQTLW